VGEKLPFPIDKAHGLYNSLYYRTSREYLDFIAGYCCFLSCQGSSHVP